MRSAPGSVFTDRHGGVSRAPYDTLNLGDHVGDDPARGGARTARASARTLRGRPRRPRAAGCGCARCTAPRCTSPPSPTGAEPPEADAAVTATRGLPLAVLTADCAPIALACRRRGRGRARRSPRPRARRDRGRGRRAARDRRTARSARTSARASTPARYEFGADDLARLVARFGPEVAGRTDDGHARRSTSPPRCASRCARCGVERPRRRRRVHGGVARPLLVPARRRHRPPGRRRRAAGEPTSRRRGRVAEVRERIAGGRARAPGATRRRSRSSRCRRTVDADAVRAAVAAGAARLRREPRAGARGEGRRALAPERRGARVALHRPAPAQQGASRSRRRSRCWHSVDRAEIGEEIARHAPGARVLVQVNVGRGAQKGGCRPATRRRLRRRRCAGSGSPSRG